MTPERYEQVRRIFLGARDLPSAQRSGYLDRACRDDAALRAEVEAFLDEQERASRFIEEPALGRGFGLTRPDTVDAIEQMPKQVGRYRIREVIGRGGMGVVYLARDEQAGGDAPDVALKLMRPEIVSPEIMRRFEHEGRVLSMLKHRGMAQIYEIGTFDAGLGVQPFIAMEYVRGEPLLDYASRRQLSMNERVELMIRICDAVQHSHMRGVIHRDLKPSNILVDESGQPKLVDFGIARLTDSDIRATHAATEAGQVLGTVPYMSPEQCDPDPYALDTRSDVYALGVVSYELLTGHLPYALGDSILQAVRSICNTPPHPLRMYNAYVNATLERIVQRALAKDKEHRLQSAAEFGDELGRFLRGEPLLTVRRERRPSRLRRVVERHRIASTVAGVIALLAIGAGLGRLAESWWARPPSRTASPSAAGLDAIVAEEVESIWTVLLSDAARAETNGADAPGALRDALDGLAARLETTPAPDPRREAVARRLLGEAYAALGAERPARAQLRRAAELSRRHFGPDHEQTRRARAALARLDSAVPPSVP